MAQPPATSDAFFREVDDELRRDQIAGAWRRWGIVGSVAVLVLLLAFGGWLYWQHRADERADRDGEALQALVDQRGASADVTMARLATSSGGGYRAVALLGQADALAAKNDIKGASAKFAAVAGDSSLGQPFRDVALIKQTAIAFDTLPPATVIQQLRGLAVPGNAWFGSAGEMTALAYLRQGRRDLAGKLFGQIAQTPDVPDTIRQRAVQMASLMGVDAAPKSGAPNSAAGATPGVIPQP